MQEENKFEDLVLQNDSKKNRQKQIIFKIIIFVIVFLIVAIIYKLMTNSSESKPTLPPMEASAEFNVKSDEQEVFENIKSDNEGFSDDFASLEERLKKENSLVDIKAKETNIIKELVEMKPSEPEKKLSNIESYVKVDNSPEKPAVIKPKPEVKVQNNSNQEKNVEKSVFDEIDIKKPVQTKPQNSNQEKIPTSTDGAYIQVYAGKNIDLKSHEIKKLENLNLQYKVLADNSGMKRVIVGPYAQKNKQEALKFIRENVKKDAFFYRAK